MMVGGAVNAAGGGHEAAVGAIDVLDSAEMPPTRQRGKAWCPDGRSWP
jgi:hypothetical protein